LRIPMTLPKRGRKYNPSIQMDKVELVVRHVRFDALPQVG
jgi:hypothetical protein